ncbi:F-box protein [Platanthera zijinensis]|uniref:F-box protein n=1 Tax=Platanthera zijinensis TaxID=2320716 RepID=A0AAP0BTC3_9ASPA
MNNFDMDQTNGVGLTDDLLVEILIRLPPKCIYRSKCVSRSWRRLIADRYVASRLPLIVSGVFYRCAGQYSGLKLDANYGCNLTGRGFEEEDLSYLPFHHNSSIIDCSNGLLLFYRSKPSAFYVCNPTTRKWAALPNPRNKSQLAVLAFDAYKSPYYRVLCFSGWQARGGQLEVFSSETGRWAERSVNWGVDTDKLSASMHFFDGALHILAHPGHIVSIDLETMSCGMIDLPEDMERDARLGNSGGFLHCAVSDAKELRIWVLKGSKWELKNRVSVAGVLEWCGGAGGEMLSGAGRLLHGQFNFSAFHPKEEVVYIWVMGKLVFYDPSVKRFGLVCEMGAGKEKIQLIQIWLIPFSENVSECLA